MPTTKAPPKKKSSKPKPGILGWGIAKQGGTILENREKQLRCQENGGTWKDGRCEY